MQEAPPGKAAKKMGKAVQTAVKALSTGQVLQPEAAREAMVELMKGESTQAQTGAFLALLSLDRCTPEVLHALADVMRSNALPVTLSDNGRPAIDVVGTGGDGQDTFNISTAAAFVVAGAGARVVKHGNRAATSKSGAADVLEALGGKLEVLPDRADRVLSEAGFVFLFARSYHPAMKFVGPIRLELGIRTVFNVLGPLTNPARPKYMLAGVFAVSLGRLYAEVFKMLGMERALVVHGKEVLDELSIAGPSMVWELKANGDIVEYEVTPADFGLETQPLSAVAGGSAEDNAKEFHELFAGGGRPAVRDMILMNAAAALYTTGIAADFKAGVEAAKAAMTNGKALAALKSYASSSNL
eukprot:TRINITY_DN103086_c0_g1_i1.p1 TRINITY_DN103086_c0_g1~~TRINITY_DN103086_c0_g1_i1.p1  ORF type:complete len:356 (+),score=91.82 TRINITY_DN103086_c0_g1_i1:57-1124(+)